MLIVIENIIFCHNSRFFIYLATITKPIAKNIRMPPTIACNTSIIAQNNRREFKNIAATVVLS